MPIGYRRDVDGLRAVAVILVVGYHSDLPFLAGGFIGVDVFFVISGFLITGLLAKEANSSNTIRLGAFYARRVRRLLPALAAAILGTLLLGFAFLLPWGEQQRLAHSALATAGFASNIHFWVSADNYFAAPVEREPLLHTWSLAVEEQFYFAWPIILLASHRLALRFGRTPRTALAAVLVAVFAASLAACALITKTAPSAAFYLMPFRAWEFAMGGLLSLVAWRPAARVASALGALGLVSIGTASILFSPQTPFPGLHALLPTLGTLAVIATGGKAASTSWLAAQPMVRVGQWSYSWYLWHWPLIAIGRATQLAPPDPVRDGTLAIAALGLAAASYRFIETPIRSRMPGPFRHERGTLAMGAVTSLAIALAGAILGLHARRTLQTTEPFRSLATSLTADTESRADCIDETSDDCQTRNWGGGPGIVLWGDSHARRLWPLVKEVGPARVRTLGSCPPLLGGVVSIRRNGEPDHECRASNERILRQIEQWASEGLVAGVALAARWPVYADQMTPAGTAPIGLYGTGQSLPVLRAGLAATMQALERVGTRVLVIAPLPEQAEDVPLCLLRRSASQCAVQRSLAVDYRRPALGVLMAEVARRPGARLADLFDALCPGVQCSAGNAGAPLYRDTNHVTNLALDRLRPGLAPALHWLIQEGVEAIRYEQGSTSTTLGGPVPVRVP